MVVKKDGCVVDSRETQRRNPKLCVCVCVCVCVWFTLDAM